MDSALSNQNRDDYVDTHGREGSVQELLEFYWHNNGGKEAYNAYQAA